MSHARTVSLDTPARAPVGTRGDAAPAPPALGLGAVGRIIERVPLIILILFVAALLGAGCSVLPPIPTGGGAGGADGPGDPRLAAESVEEPVRDLPKSARGNMAEYTVFGQRYRTLATSEGYREQGVASWYGAKFHGRDTSSGEPFDMHAMTAAHRHLPLPTFVRVTNVANGRSVVVKVNDRGPFADDRVIDLSYAAATRLDMLSDGTADVTLEALSTHPADVTTALTAEVTPDATPIATFVTPVPERRPREPIADIIQLGAFADDVRAVSLARRVEPHLATAPRVEHDVERALWRVRIGPLADAAALSAALAGLEAAGIEDFALITTTPR